ncbi:hypothetical protein F7725_015870 [Dissostichus mawsoni]|uniref:Uncharacterized protein n=1 Tax=Dissostichus mawsoni TaxID=36200 RepID=A0A7J5YJN8_DISMA|nr:hypothetical protein F7725_015870 [Dissostichus mawsoni]
MPDVLGISQNALCPDDSCEWAQKETGTAEPCEHQLDLLVDVIDFLSIDHAEVSEDESYNEAAQTLLTIGNLAHLSQSAQNQIAVEDQLTGPDMDPTSQLTSKTDSPQTRRARLSKDCSVKITTGDINVRAAEESPSDAPDLSQAPCPSPALDMKPSVDLASTPTLTEELSGVSGATTSTRRASENKDISEAQFEIRREPDTRDTRSTYGSTDEDMMSHVGTSEMSCNNPLTSDTVVAEMQIGQGSNNDHPASCVLPVSEKEKSEVKSTTQTRKSRFQKVKPNPNLTQTSRSIHSKAQTSKDTIEKDSDSTPVTKFHEKTIAEVEAEPTFTTSTEKQSQSDVPHVPELTDEVLMSDVKSESRCNNPLKSNAAATDLQLGQGSIKGSVQESKDHPATCVTPVEKLPVGEKEGSEVKSTSQARKSRFQKIKPNLNLAQTSRTVRSKAQTSKDNVEKDSDLTPTIRFHEKTIAEVEAVPTCTTSPEKPSQSHGPSSDCIPSLDFASTLTPTEELSGISSTNTSQQSASENQNLSETQIETRMELDTKNTWPTSESTDEVIMSHVWTAESSCNNPVISDAAATELQIGQGSNTDSVQETNDHPAPCVIPLEELPVSEKEGSKENRFQKIKPNLNLAQTSRTFRSKAQTSKDHIEKDSDSTPATKFHEKTISELDAEPTCTASPDKPSHSHVPSSDLKPSLDLASTLNPTEELSGISGATTSQQSASENKDISEAQFEIRREPDTRDTRSTYGSTDEDMMSHVGTSEMSCNNPLTSDTVVAEMQIGQGSNNDHPASCVLPVSEKEKSEVKSTTQTRKSRFQKVKPNPNLTQTSRSIHSKAQTSKDTIEKDSDSTPVTKFHEKTIAEVEAEPTFTTSTEKQSQSDVPHVPELTDEVLMSDVKSESRCNNPLKSNAAATDLQLGQGSIKGSVQESKDHPATCVTPVEKLPVGEKEGSEVKSTSQARKSRFQKIKPNLNLAQTSRTVRSKAQTSKDNVEKDSDLTPTIRFHEKTIAEVEAVPTCTTSPEKPSQSHGPSSDCIPSLDFGITLKPTEELSTTEEKETDLEVVSGSTTTQQIASETQNLSEAQFEPSRGQETRDTKPASESTDESASSVTPVIELPVSQKEASEVKYSCKTIRIRLQQVKPKSNLTQTSRTAQSKLQVTKDPLLPMPQAETCSSPTSRPNLPDKTTAEVEAQPSCSTIPSEQPSHSTASVSVQSLELDSTPKTIEQNKNVACESSSEGSEQSVSQRRQRFPKVEAGPGSQSESKQDMFFKATKTITQPTDGPTTVSDVQSSGDGSTESQIDSMQSTNKHSTPDPKESTQEPPTENDPEAPSQDAVQQSSETNETSVKSPDDKQPEPTDSPSGKAPPTRRGRLIKPKPTLGRSRRPPQHVQNTQQAEAGLTSFKKKKFLPKRMLSSFSNYCNLSPYTDVGILSEGGDDSICPKLVAELLPDIQKPVEGAIDQSSNTIPSPKDADTSLGISTEVIEQLSQHEPLVEVSGLSTGCATQVSDSGTQDASTSSAGGTQGHPSFTIFPDMMLPQDPSDPDEPFFILSLTEIPVSSSGEGVDSVPEPLPSLPVADAPIEQQSVPGESLATPEEQPPPNVTVPVPMEDSNETGVIHVKDPDDGSTEGNQVDPHERTTVHPSTVQETGQNKDETEIPLTKERQTGTRRRETAKPQVKPKTTKRKQTSKTAAAKKAESPPSKQTPRSKASDDTEPQRERADHVEVEKETLTDVVDPEGTSSGAKTTRTKKQRILTPAKQLLRALRKKIDPAAVASTPCEVTPKPGPNPGQHASEHSRPRSEQSPSTSLCPAEGSTSQPSEYMESSSLEEEPTSVSQYFLSDIFTDVEEG